MKRQLFLVLVGLSLASAADQNTKNDFGVTLRAESQQRKGSLIVCRGNVEMKTESFVLRAEEVQYHSDTGEVEASGAVRIRLFPANTLSGNPQHH